MFPQKEGIPILLSPEARNRATIEDSRWRNHPIEGESKPPELALEHKKEYIRLFEELVLKDISFEGRILEIGAGSCWASSLVKRSNPRCFVYASDVSVNALFKGREVSRLLGASIDRYVACDVQRLPFPDEYFSFVFGVAVLHHAENLPAALREIERVLKPGGTYIGLREGMASPLLKPLYRAFSGGVREESQFGEEENVYSYQEWDAMLSNFDHRIILRHSPELGVGRREKAYYAMASLLPEGLLRHLTATIKIVARKRG